MTTDGGRDGFYPYFEVAIQLQFILPSFISSFLLCEAFLLHFTDTQLKRE